MQQSTAPNGQSIIFADITVDNGAVKTSFEELDLSRIAEDAAIAFEVLYFERELTLTTAIERNIRLLGSVAHLRQVLDILLDNAMKYSTPGGTFQVKLIRQGARCILSAAITGLEISEEDLRNIFKRFYRIDKARGRNGSYGLELSIAQSIVDKHGGKIWAESEGGVHTFCVIKNLQLVLPVALHLLQFFGIILGSYSDFERFC